jgi:hypothetical protein
MLGALPYKNLKESKAEETREVDTKESEAPEFKFEPSEAKASEEIWIY